MKPKSPIKRLIDNSIQDPELKQLFLSTPELQLLQDEIKKEFQTYEDRIRRYQERLRFNLKDTQVKSAADEKEIKSLAYKAYHDGLTGLPNRTYLFERIEAAIMQAHRHANPFAIMFIDLDGFKTINDTYGHDFGDMMLQLVANRLVEITRETDMVARLAGDEFCVHLMNMETAAHSARVAKAIIEGFNEPIKVDGHAFQINLSIGISHYPMDGQTTKQLMKNADVAMYEAKKRGSNLFQFYEHRLTERVTERLEFEKDLADAIAEQELELTFQPYLNLANGKINLLDVGMHWKHDVRGHINSELFYQGTANSQVLMRLLEWQVSECTRLQNVWQLRGYPATTMRIHIDEKQFFHKELFKYLSKGTNAATDIDIELVISEACFQSDPETSKRILRQANKQGFKSGLDFKGAGFLPIKTLKDSIINSLTIEHNSLSPSIDEEEHSNLIQGLKLLCDSIAIDLSVSGIETDIQQKRYVKHGVTMLSGPHFTEPQSEEQLESVLKRFKDTNAVINSADSYAKIVNN